MSEQSTPLKVTALAASAQLGGTERVLLDFANRAFEHDVALRVLTPRDGPLVTILNKIGVPAEIVPAPERLLRGSQREGGLWSLPPALLSMRGWAKQVADHPFVTDAEVVYTIAFKTHVAGALARLHPVVWHLHEFPPRKTGWVWRLLTGRVPDRMIAVSDAVGDAWASRPDEVLHAREDGKQEAQSRKRIAVVHNGVNLDRFQPRGRTGWIHEELGIPREHRIIGMPAVFARWKGQLEVLDAFSQIADEFPDVHLVIVGGSIYDTVAERQYGEQLEQATGEWEITTSSGGRWEAVEPGSGEWRVPSEPTDPGAGPKGERETAAASDVARGKRASGPVPGSRLPRVHILPFQKEIELAYPEFELTIHYSLRPEPFGRVIVESMACGVPIVAADEGGPREIVGDGIGPRREAGWLAEPRNPTELARILHSALSLPTEVLASIGTAGRERAEDNFSSRAFSARLAAVLKETAGHGKRG